MGKEINFVHFNLSKYFSKNNKLYFWKPDGMYTGNGIRYGLHDTLQMHMQSECSFFQP